MVFWVTAISAAGNLACALAPSLPLLVAARFASGATVGAIVPLAIAWIGDAVPYEQPPAGAGALPHRQHARRRAGHDAVRLARRALSAGRRCSSCWPASTSWPRCCSGPSCAPIRRRRPGRRRASRMAAAFRAHARPDARSLGARRAGHGVLRRRACSTAASHSPPITRTTRSASALRASGAAGARSPRWAGCSTPASPGAWCRASASGGLVIGGGMLLCVGLPGLALAPGPCVGRSLPGGAGHGPVHDAQHAAGARDADGARVARRARWRCSRSACSPASRRASGSRRMLVDALGTAPVFFVAAAGLPLLALEFQRRLAMHRHAA